MVDFINEVEDELRKDSYNALLRKWGPYIVGACILIVATAGAMEYLKSASERKAKSTSISYVAAQAMLDEENTADAFAKFMAIADKADPGYAGLSLMNAAAIKLDEGQGQQAVALFDRAASAFDTDLHQQLAQLKAAYILADLGEYDAVKTRIAPLAEREAPFEYLARELQGFTALNTGDVQGARAQFAYLSTSLDVTPGIQERAEQVLALTPALSGMSAAEIEAAAKEAAPQESLDVEAPAPASPDDAASDDTPTPDPSTDGNE